MNERYPLVNHDVLQTIPPELLQKVFDALPFEFYILKAVRENGGITGFEYALLNQAAEKIGVEKTLVGKKFLIHTPEGSNLFARMVKVVEHGTAFQETTSAR